MKAGALICGLMVTLWAAVGHAAVPRVVASVKPLQSIAAGVMDGIGTPDLLIKGAASPHAYALRPSDAEMLATADVIFWIGPDFETFLTRPLAASARKSEIITLTTVPGLNLLASRDAGIFERDGEPTGGHVDGHLWLDVRNASVIAKAMATTLAALDPEHAAHYLENAAGLDRRLAALDVELEAMLSPVKSRPFVVYHDAYHYFEARYGLNDIGALTANPERGPGGRRVSALRARIEQSGAVCLFAEPQFTPKLMQSLAAETSAKIGVLDPEASTLPPGPLLIFDLLRGLAVSLQACLSAR